MSKCLYIAILVCVFNACSNSNKILTLEASNHDLELVNGIFNFNDFPFTGRLVSYFTNRNLESEVFYVEGKKQGFEKHWFENCNLAVERSYKNGFKTGIHKAWWKNGKPKFEYHFNNKGEFHGSVKEWYQTGTLFRDFNYENGIEVGSQKLWYETGKIKANYVVVNNERYGLIGLKKCYMVIDGIDEVK